MTVSFNGNSFIPFDEVTISTDAASGTIDICDDSNQNICLVAGTMGAATDASFTRFELLTATNNSIYNVKGNSAALGPTGTTQLATNLMPANYVAMGNLSSDSAITGERISFMIWIQASQNSSQPFYDVHVNMLSTHTYIDGNAYQGRTGAYYQGIAVPRKLKFYMNTGNVSTASLKSYILGAN